MNNYKPNNAGFDIINSLFSGLWKAIKKLFMKKIMLIMFLFISFTGRAQSTEWEKLKMDSAKFMETFGSVYEYKVQESIKSRSKHKWKVLFIGAKAGYINDLILYLAEKHWAFDIDEKETKIKVIATTYNNEFGYDAKLNIQFSLDSNRRFTKASITGSANDVINLFLDYWENYNINYSDLKQKKSVYTMNATDKVSFAWINKTPTITITKGVADLMFFKKQNSSE